MKPLVWSLVAAVSPPAQSAALAALAPASAEGNEFLGESRLSMVGAGFARGPASLSENAAKAFYFNL